MAPSGYRSGRATQTRRTQRRPTRPPATELHPLSPELAVDPGGPLRLGLCCGFRDEPIRFRTTTATSLARRPRHEQLTKLAELCRDNAASLLAALEYCRRQRIGCFRALSQIWPLATHPELGYDLADLPGGEEIRAEYARAGDFARASGLRTCLHPDQFVVLNSQRPDVVEKSLAELEYQARLAELIAADVINIHGGGAFGDKPRALEVLARNLARLSPAARSRITLENDDRTYSPADLEPLCRREGVPLVYDVHHHRCLPDGWSIAEATARARQTWNREPLFHLSSPLGGWQSADPRHHDDRIDPADFPEEWRGLALTVEVEAKGKERAVLALVRALAE